MKKLFLFLLIVILYSITIKSEEPYVLTLEESILVAKNQSYAMLNLKENIKIAEYNLDFATSGLKTQIELALWLPNYNETVKMYEDTTGAVTFFPSRQINYKGDLSITQPLPTDGKIFITSGLNSIDDLRNDIVNSTLGTRIGFSQPVDIIYGYSGIRNTLKNAKLEYELTSKKLKRGELELVLEVSNSYYSLLNQQSEVEISQLDLERQKEAYEISKNKYEAGLIREVDALQMEVELANAQYNYEMSILRYESDMNLFKKLIGLNLTDNIKLKKDTDYKIVIVDPDEAVRFALANRLEIKEREIDIERKKMSIKEQKVKGRVRGSIEAYIEKSEINDLNRSNSLFNSIGGSFDNFIDFTDLHRPKYGVGFNINVPILDGGRNKSLVKMEEANLQQIILEKENQIQGIEVEIRNLVATLNSNLKQLQILEKNVKVAEKSFDITLQRFADGDIDSQALALERNRLNNAYRTHFSAYITYRLSITQLMQKTFYDFENEQLIE